MHDVFDAGDIATQLLGLQHAAAATRAAYVHVDPGTGARKPALRDVTIAVGRPHGAVCVPFP
jgi:hypothetical protein